MSAFTRSIERLYSPGEIPPQLAVFQIDSLKIENSTSFWTNYTAKLDPFKNASEPLTIYEAVLYAQTQMVEEVESATQEKDPVKVNALSSPIDFIHFFYKQYETVLASTKTLRGKNFVPKANLLLKTCKMLYDTLLKKDPTLIQNWMPRILSLDELSY